MKKEIRYHYSALNELMIIQLIGPATRDTRYVEVNILYSELPYYPLGKLCVLGKFWARSELFTGRASKIDIIRKKFEK